MAMNVKSGLLALPVLASAGPATAEETPKQGGTLTYMIHDPR